MQIDNSALEPLMREVRALCTKLPMSEEYIMVHHPALRVGKKPFFIAGMNVGEEAPTLSVNLGPMMQGELLDDPRFTRTPYIGQHGWVTVHRRDLSKTELARLLEDSWRRIATAKALAAKDGAPARSRSPRPAARDER